LIVASRLSAKLDIGGFVLQGNYVGPDHPAGHPSRERIAGFEITRDVPTTLWERWEARTSFERAGVVFGTEDETALAEWCWRNVRPHGHAHGAPQS
jgi:hypothetical protein